jgi:hypothetical protein
MPAQESRRHEENFAVEFLESLRAFEADVIISSLN